MGKKLPSKSKGGIGQAFATAYFLSQHCIVSQPLYDNAPYDLIVDDGGRLLRVQCRYSAATTKGTRSKTLYIHVDLRTGGGAGRWSNKAAWRTCRAENFDLLWVMTPAAYYLIPTAALFAQRDERTYIALTPRWDQYRIDYAHPGPLEAVPVPDETQEEPPLLILAE